MGRGSALPWPGHLGPVGGRGHLFEGGRGPNQYVDPRKLQPIHNWFPVGLWLGTPGLSSEVDVETLVFAFAMFGSDTGIEVTGVVWCRESATKTNQTISLTIGVGQFGIVSVVGHGFEEIGHQPLPGRYGSG